jgi:cell fate (sporulation/competence/biofilm development) regulator YlbF (YheA/YmcA/DUF963 family)
MSFLSKISTNYKIEAEDKEDVILTDRIKKRLEESNKAIDALLKCQKYLKEYLKLNKQFASSKQKGTASKRLTDFHQEFKAKIDDLVEFLKKEEEDGGLIEVKQRNY